MRARYYEPGSGRFISEDPARDGWNWFAYCGNDPVGRVDVTGRSPIRDLVTVFGGLGGGFLSMAMIIMKFTMDPTEIAYATGLAAMSVVFTGLAIAFGSDDVGFKFLGGGVSALIAGGLFFSAKELLILGSTTASATVGLKTCAAAAISACFAYSILAMSLIKMLEFEDIAYNLMSGSSM